MTSSMAATLSAGGAPDWQIRLGANWQALDKTTSTLLEAAFMSAIECGDYKRIPMLI